MTKKRADRDAGAPYAGSIYRAPSASGGRDASHLEELRSIKIGFSVGNKPWTERVIQVGRVYRIIPHNPLKLRNRDRVCRVLGFTTVSSTHGEVVARVRFLDNNRQGRAELSELVLLDEVTD